jgi:hypothetical protein
VSKRSLTPSPVEGWDRDWAGAVRAWERHERFVPCVDPALTEDEATARRPVRKADQEHHVTAPGVSPAGSRHRQPFSGRTPLSEPPG